MITRVKSLDGPFTKILQWAAVVDPLHFAWWANKALRWISALRHPLDKPGGGRGPQSVLSAPFLASKSACLLPSKSEWLGTQTSFTLLWEERLHRVSQHSFTNFEVWMLDENALIAAWLSDRILMLSPLIPRSIKDWPTINTANISAWRTVVCSPSEHIWDRWRSSENTPAPARLPIFEPSVKTQEPSRDTAPLSHCSLEGIRVLKGKLKWNDFNFRSDPRKRSGDYRFEVDRISE